MQAHNFPFLETPSRIAIVTDAWDPQINGVVHTLKSTCAELRRQGHVVKLICATDLRSFGLPGFPDVRLALQPYDHVRGTLDSFSPDYIHLATEGPLGLAARRYCLRRQLAFTSSYHTRFPEYLRARCGLPKFIGYRWLRWFHRHSQAIMVPTQAIREQLIARGFSKVVLWGRGVDTEHFRPAHDNRHDRAIERPLHLYVGRVAVEKNIEQFLALDLPGSKWVIGDGPHREALEAKFPGVRFLGAKSHRDLPGYYNYADVFVFPSRTDTFGLVLVEAMACGVPIAAYPVAGPIDVVAHTRSGILDDDLAAACRAALTLDRAGVRAHALEFSWEAATRQFQEHLHPAGLLARHGSKPAWGKREARPALRAPDTP